MLLLPELAHSQLISHKGIVPDTYDFWVYMPEGRSVKDTTKLPLVLFLHGTSLCGNDITRVRKYGPLDALKFGRKIDAIILAPQAQGSWQPSKVLKVLEWTEGHYPVDSSRVYVFGMSMGGYGTIDFVGTYPDKVAAAIAMCGGGSLKDYSGLGKVPFWIIHGTSDSAVSYKESQKVIDAVRASAETDLLRSDFMEGVNHSRLGRVFYMKEPYEWLFRHSLADSVRTVDRTVKITKEGMANAYKGLPGRKDLKVVAYKGGPSASSETASDSVGEPVEPTTDQGSTEVRTYIIKKGDTLEKIARRNGTTVDSLCEKNGITRKTILHIGRKLVL